MKPTIEIKTLGLAMEVALDAVRATGSGDGQAAVDFLINEIDRLQALIEKHNANPPARVGDLPPGSHFEYQGRVHRRSGVYCVDLQPDQFINIPDRIKSLDADTIVTPRPDADANVARQP